MATEPDLHFSDATWWHLVTESTHSFCLLKFAFYLTIILQLGFLRNSTLVDAWTRNQGRQSARTVNVSENKKKKGLCKLFMNLTVYLKRMPRGEGVLHAKWITPCCGPLFKRFWECSKLVYLCYDVQKNSVLLIERKLTNVT